MTLNPEPEPTYDPYPQILAKLKPSIRLPDGTIITSPEPKAKLRFKPEQWHIARTYLLETYGDNVLFSEPFKPLAGGTVAHEMERYIRIARNLRKQCLRQLAAIESHEPQQPELFDYTDSLLTK